VASVVDHHGGSMDGGSMVEMYLLCPKKKKKGKGLRRFENAYAVVFPKVHFQQV
jgi:hypothetical protein